MKTIAHLQSMGVSVLFRFGPETDMHNSTMTIAGVYQGGLGLPDRDYYLKEDAKSKETREKYLEHMGKMFELLGDKAEAATAEAQAVMGIETTLAKAAMDRVAIRNPENRDHPMTPKQLASLAPALEFSQYLVAAGAPAIDKVNVVAPDFFKQVNAQLD